jgi:hypothetical protein
MSTSPTAGFDVGRDKTDAGMREVDMLPLLRAILTEHKVASHAPAPTTLGHTDPTFTLRVYSHMMRRSAGERERLKALVEATFGQ